MLRLWNAKEPHDSLGQVGPAMRSDLLRTKEWKNSMTYCKMHLLSGPVASKAPRLGSSSTKSQGNGSFSSFNLSDGSYALMHFQYFFANFGGVSKRLPESWGFFQPSNCVIGQVEPVMKIDFLNIMSSLTWIAFFTLHYWQCRRQKWRDKTSSNESWS